MGKAKKEKQSAADESVGDVEIKQEIKEEDTYEDKLKNCSIIAHPMAPKKLTKKCLKLIKKGTSNGADAVADAPFQIEFLMNFFMFLCSATKQKTFLRNGLKDVQSRLKKGEHGYALSIATTTTTAIADT